MELRRSPTPFLRHCRVTLLSATLAGLSLGLLSSTVEAAVLQSKTYQYDAMGRIVVETDASNNSISYTYDANGNRKTRTDALSRTTSYDYDALNRLVKVTDPAGGITQYDYDARDNLVTVTDPRGLSTTYTYNGLDQLLTQASPDTGTTTYTPNAAGQVLTRSNAASQATQYQYDALGRVTQANYADGRVVTYIYDQGVNGAGRLTSVSDAESSISWTYDADGHVLTRTQVIGIGAAAVTSTLTHGYNAAGQLTSLTLPSGKVVTYTYDDQGRVSSLSYDGTVVLSNVQYRPFGGITGWTWGNGQVHSRTYDQNGRLDLLSVGNTVHDLGYDAASRIDSIVDMANATQNRDFSYDTLDRLIGYNGQNSTRTWTYDAVGNRTGQTVGSATESYSYAASSNRLTGMTRSNGQNRSYQYTATGHTSSNGVSSFTYDARERLVGVTTPVATASYLVNPLGQRVRKSVTQSGVTTTTYFVYDEGGHLVAESDSTGTSSEHLFLGDIPVAMHRAALQNGLGTPLELDDAVALKAGRYNRWASTTMPSALGGGVSYVQANAGLPEGIVVDNDNVNNSAPNTFSLSSNRKWFDVTTTSSWGGTIASASTATTLRIIGNQGAPQGTVLDDGQAVAAGSWSSGSCTNDCWGGGFRTGNSGTGTPVLTWSTSIATPGDYAIYAFSPLSNQSSTYTISHAGGSATVNLTSPPVGRWGLIGTYTMPTGALTVSLTTAAGKSVVYGDAILVAPVNAPLAYFNKATWTVNLPEAGSYEVYAYLQENSSAGVVQYSVNDASGPHVVSVNQAFTDNRRSVLIGTFNFNAGVTSVSLSDQGALSQYIRADALIFARPGAPKGDYNTVTWTPSLPSAGQYEVQVRWPVIDPAWVNWEPSNAATFKVRHVQGETAITKDQTQSAGAWVSLGQFSLDPATARVTVLDLGQSGRRVYADGVRFVPMLNQTDHHLYYVHADHLNTPRQLTSSTGVGATVWRWDGEPFGSTLADSDPDGDGKTVVFNLRFPGQYFDAETQLHYNYYRDYDPGTGRYIESDPIGLHGGINTYSYVNDDPISGVDEMGLANSGGRGRQERWKMCSAMDLAYCNVECGARGVKSCRRKMMKMSEIINGVVVTGPREVGKPSCQCNDEEENECPAPSPLKKLFPSPSPQSETGVDDGSDASESPPNPGPAAAMGAGLMAIMAGLLLAF